MTEPLYLIRNVEARPNIEGSFRPGVVEPYYSSREDGLPLAVTRDMFPEWIDRLVPVPDGMKVSMEWLEMLGPRP